MNNENDNLIVISYFQYFNIKKLNYSDYSFIWAWLWLFAAVPDEPPLPEQQPLPDSSRLVVDEQTPLPHALCGPAGAAISPARPAGATISTDHGYGCHGNRGDYRDRDLSDHDGSAGLPAVVGAPVDRRRRPPLARRIARQCLPPVGCRQQARVLRCCGRCQTSARASAAALHCSHAASAAVDLSRVTASCGHRPLSNCLRDRVVCHEAIGPSSRCRLGRPILAASLPDIRPLAILVCLVVLPRTMRMTHN